MVKCRASFEGKGGSCFPLIIWRKKITQPMPIWAFEYETLLPPPPKKMLKIQPWSNDGNGNWNGTDIVWQAWYFSKITYIVYLARYHPFICSPISPIYSILRYPFPLGISLGKCIVTVSSSSEGTILQALMMSWSSTLIVASFRSKLTEFKTTDVVLLHT